MKRFIFCLFFSLFFFLFCSPPSASADILIHPNAKDTKKFRLGEAVQIEISGIPWRQEDRRAELGTSYDLLVIPNNSTRSVAKTQVITKFDTKSDSLCTAEAQPTEHWISPSCNPPKASSGQTFTFTVGLDSNKIGVDPNSTSDLPYSLFLKTGNTEWGRGTFTIIAPKAPRSFHKIIKVTTAGDNPTVIWDSEDDSGTKTVKEGEQVIISIAPFKSNTQYTYGRRGDKSNPYATCPDPKEFGSCRFRYTIPKAEQISQPFIFLGVREVGGEADYTPQLTYEEKNNTPVPSGIEISEAPAPPCTPDHTFLENPDSANACKEGQLKCSQGDQLKCYDEKPKVVLEVVGPLDKENDSSPAEVDCTEIIDSTSTGVKKVECVELPRIAVPDNPTDDDTISLVAHMTDTEKCYVVELHRIADTQASQPLLAKAYDVTPPSVSNECPGIGTILGKNLDDASLDRQQNAFWVFRGKGAETTEPFTLPLPRDGAYKAVLYEVLWGKDSVICGTACQDKFVTEAKFLVGTGEYPSAIPPCTEMLVIDKKHNNKLKRVRLNSNWLESYEKLAAKNNYEFVKCVEVQTAIGAFRTDPREFVKDIMAVLLSISGMIAIIMIIRSGYIIMMSRADPEKIQQAREILTSAIVGLLFLIFSLVILEVIGVDILRIPGLCDTPECLAEYEESISPSDESPAPTLLSPPAEIPLDE